MAGCGAAPGARGRSAGRRVLAAAPAALLAALLAALAPRVAAAADVAPVHIDYAADLGAGPGCPDAAAFVEAVRAQSAHVRLAAPGEPARALRVRIARSGDDPATAELRGQLEIEELDGTTSVRDVGGAACSDVAGALALVTALAIDAGPLTPAPPPEPRPPAPEPPPAKPRPRPPARPPPPRPPADLGAARSQIGAQGAVWGAIAPNPAWGGQPFYDWGDWRGGLAPSVRISLALLEAPASTTPSGTEATFGWIGLRLQGSLWSTWAGPVLLRPAAGVEIGALSGRGASVARPLDQTRAWLSASLGGRAQWPLAERFVVELEAGILIPFTRDTFVFQDPDEQIHRAPTLSGVGAVGLGVLLPM